jgi:hypothetical protein
MDRAGRDPSEVISEPSLSTPSGGFFIERRLPAGGPLASCRAAFSCETEVEQHP